jgi:putative aldouronate transport system substrate-binding protein
MGRLVNSDQDEKVIEKIMKFSDWLYTEEGFLRSIEGEEGVDYIMINEDPAEWVTLNESYADKIPDEYQNLIISVEEIAARRADLPYHLYGFRSIAPIWSVFHNEWHPEQTSKEQLADEKYYESGWYGVPDPVVSLKGDELEEYNNLYATIKDYSDQIIAQMITGQMDIEKEWDTFQENLEIYGYSRLVELYNIGSQNFRSIVPNYQP